MRSTYGTIVALFESGVEVERGKDYVIYKAFGLTYDEFTNTVTAEPLVCDLCDTPVGRWEFLESKRRSMNGYGCCTNGHMVTIGPDNYGGRYSVQVAAAHNHMDANVPVP